MVMVDSAGTSGDGNGGSGGPSGDGNGGSGGASGDERPDRPEVKLMNVTSRSALFQWYDVFSGNLNVTLYTVFYTSIEGNLTVNITDDRHQYRFINLFPATLYTFYATATNCIGTSEPAVIKRVTEEDVPMPPRNVNASAVSSTSIRVTWSVPQRTNGKLTWYKVYYWPTNTSDSEQVMETSGDNTNAVIRYLHPYTNYSMQVQAATAKGPGDRSEVVGPVRTFEDAPSAPRNVSICNITAHAFTVTWLDPAISNGILNNFLVGVQLAENGDKIRNTTLPIGEIKRRDGYSYRVEGLLAYTNYSVQIIAVTSEPGNASTPLPDVPTM
ncbi:predicted protein [Nematostella vectensis]|uniref:Fibronectin type-III domain-containing protein n=1 Tax=Nematostella vectensis TaxID=45351 RepID=A8DUX7_NEMVE|nr:predicted protein [Nematostella vectensis]|eukprot:XP_001619435.1 hypothetical protein NEMVEDRAFT_v1g224185 [Nematostella vectensis]